MFFAQFLVGVGVSHNRKEKGMVYDRIIRVTRMWTKHTNHTNHTNHTVIRSGALGEALSTVLKGVLLGFLDASTATKKQCPGRVPAWRRPRIIRAACEKMQKHFKIRQNQLNTIQTAYANLPNVHTPPIPCYPLRAVWLLHANPRSPTLSRSCYTFYLHSTLSRRAF